MAERKWSSPRLFAFYDGDRVAAERLERRARCCVGYLFDQLRPGQTYRTQTWNYKDGSRIKAYVWRDVLGERARVEIFSPFIEKIDQQIFLGVESGLLILPNIYELTEDATTPAQYIWLPGQVTASEFQENNALDNWAGGSTFVWRPGSTSGIVSASLGTAVNATIKYWAWRTAIFELTAKLRLLAQVQQNGLFRKKTEITRFVQWLFDIRIDNFGLTVHERADYSFWLYTLEPGIYFVIRLINGVLSARRLVPKNEYEFEATAFLGKLTSGDFSVTNKFYQRYEAYLLATCDFLEDEDWIELETFEISGFALAYGWKPTWNGDRASIVTHTQTTGDPPTKRTARLYTITLQENLAFDPREPITASNFYFTAHLTLEEEEEWAPKITREIIWTPMPAALQASTFWYPHPCSVTPAPAAWGNVPVYCFFDYLDRRICVRHSATPAEEEQPLRDTSFNTWKDNIAGWFAHSGNSLSFTWDLYGDFSSFSVEIGNQVGTGRYADPNYLFDEPAAITVGGLVLEYHEVTDYVYTNQVTADCPAYRIYPNNTIGLTKDPDWVDWNFENRQYVFASSGNQVRDITTVEDNAPLRRPVLIITSGNPDSFILMDYEYKQHKNVTANTVAYNKLFKNTALATSEVKWDWATFSEPFGGAGGGCAPDSTVSSFDENIDSIHTVSRYVFDSWGMQVFDDVSDTGELAVPLGMFGLIRPTPCGGATPSWTGWLLTMAGIEGAKFFNNNPSSLANMDFTSNFGKDWDTEHASIFAGWQ